MSATETKEEIKCKNASESKMHEAACSQAKVASDESVEFFSDHIRGYIQDAIKKALDLDSCFTVEISYHPEEKKFSVSERVRNTWEHDDWIAIAQVEPWHLTDEGLDISVEEAEKMSDEEKSDIADNCADDWIDQFDEYIEEGEKAIAEFFNVEEAD